MCCSLVCLGMGGEVGAAEAGKGAGGGGGHSLIDEGHEQQRVVLHSKGGEKQRWRFCVQG
jgi:hypothetical protein